MITRIEAYRYRCFSKLAIDLQPYCVFAGPNGSGKSTLLDIPVLLGDCILERVCSDAFLKVQPSRGSARAHTLKELIHQERGTDFVLALEAEVPEEVVDQLLREATPTVKDQRKRWLDRLRYEVRFQIFEGGLDVLNEYLYAFPSQGKCPHLGGGLQGEPELEPDAERAQLRLREKSWRSIIHRDKGKPARITTEGYKQGRIYRFSVPRTRLALANLPFDPDAFPSAVWFQEQLSDGTVLYDPEYRTLREASAPGKSLGVTRTGENIAWLALELQRNSASDFKYWVEHVKTALTNIDSITAVEREEDHHAYLRVKYKGGFDVTSSGLSQGTLRVIAMTLVAYVKQPPPILIIEQPEDGVHPAGIEPILQSLSSITESQVWLSTHSPIVLAQTDLDKLIITRITAGGAVEAIRGHEHPRFKEWKGDLDLGTFYAAGVLD